MQASRGALVVFFLSIGCSSPMWFYFFQCETMEVFFAHSYILVHALSNVLSFFLSRCYSHCVDLSVFVGKEVAKVREIRGPIKSTVSLSALFI